MTLPLPARARQSGATLIEFCLVLLIFMTFLLGLMDFSRMLYTWNAATEAARAGARYAVVCDDTYNKTAVRQRMQALMPEINADSKIDIAWVPSGCTAATCEGVSVSLTNVTYQWISPIAGVAGVPPITLPAFSTFLTREVMRQDTHSGDLCS